MNVDNDTLRRIEGWRALGDNVIETIIKKNDKVKDLKKKPKSDGLSREYIAGRYYQTGA